MTSLTGVMDGDDLRVRLTVIEDPTMRMHLVNCVHGVFLGRARIQRVDLAGLEKAIGAATPRELWGRIAEPITNLWTILEDVLIELKAVAEAHGDSAALGADEGGGGAGDELDFAMLEEPSASPAQKVSPFVAPDPKQSIVNRIVETAWAMSYVLKNEVSGFQRRLNGLQNSADGWDLVGACQDHLARLRSALDALLTGIASSLPGSRDGQMATDPATELLAARELRTRVFALRDEILAIELETKAQPVSAWHELLVAAREHVDSFMFGPGFAWLRADDKRSFLRAQKVLTEVLELWSPLRAVPAQRALGGLARYLEALEVINQRECLLVHDRNALHVVLTELRRALHGSGTAARDAVASALKALAEAQGRDRELDDLLGETMVPGTDVPVQAIITRAEAVSAALG